MPIKKKMVFKRKISPEMKAYCFYLLTSKDRSIRSIAREVGISPSSVLRIQRDFRSGRKRDQATENCRRRGPREKLSERQKRCILRCFLSMRENGQQISCKRLMSESGITTGMISERTISRFLNSKGYFYLQARKKGLLSRLDFQKRVAFTKRMQSDYVESVWEEQIAFYLDGKSFVYKTNPLEHARSPKARVWRKPSEGLAYACTAKGRKEGSGGRILKLIVAISFGKGVVVCEPYEKMTGAFFSSFIEKHFQSMFLLASKGDSRLWLQDGCPCQNSAQARNAMTRVNAILLKIPPRSPDLNPIENFFNIVSTKLENDAIARNISKESFVQFQQRVIHTIYSIPVQTINNLISSMPRRIKAVIKAQGERTKY